MTTQPSDESLKQGRNRSWQAVSSPSPSNHGSTLSHPQKVVQIQFALGTIHRKSLIFTKNRGFEPDAGFFRYFRAYIWIEHEKLRQSDIVSLKFKNV